MTIERLMQMVQELTHTPISDTVLLNWISNCENTILTDIFLAAPENCTEYTEITGNALLVPHPFDKLYLPYMQAQIYHAAGEFMQYQNYMALYNEYRDEYARYVLSTVQPANGDAVNEGYYLTAYAIAAAHGYSGSEEDWLRSLKGDTGPKGETGPKGDTGETALPVARGQSIDGISYVATDADSGTVLPVVSVANSAEQISAEGKGRQIVFIPYITNVTNSPTLQINGGEVIPIRVRAPKNQGSDESAPDATLPVPVGALMRGVQYTMTFCGKYWLVDSLIDLHPEAVTQETVGAMIAEAIGDTAGALAEMDHVIGGAGA